MKVYFSNQGNLRNFRKFAEELDFAAPNSLEIIVNEKWTVVHPANLVIAAAMALKAGKWGTDIVGRVPESARNLEKMGLYDFVRTKSPFKREKNTREPRMIPLTVIESREDRLKLIDQAVQNLALNAREAIIIKFILNELIFNALNYSNSDDGVVIAAQYSKKTNRVSIAACDLGEGLWGSLDKNWHPRNDLEAIHLALTPGVTAEASIDKFADISAGSGLFTLKSIARRTRDYFVVYSGTAQYTLLKGDKRLKRKLKSNPTADAHSETNDMQPFQGTLVAMDVSLDALQDELCPEVRQGDLRPNFQSDEEIDVMRAQMLLNSCIEAYADAMYERKISKVKEPNIA